MLSKRFYDAGLAQASYLLGCQATGEALVVDPNRDVEQYLRAAVEEGLRVTHVTETHIHADFVSGSRELAQRAGARLLLSNEGGADWRYAFADAAGATLLRDGDAFMVGNLKLEVLHTPGHTPEHLTFVITDTPATNRPMGALTGDFIFVGDVGRPDLLERAAHVAGSMEQSARTLYHSLQRFARQILQCLRGGERTVTELVADTGLGQANVSKHLRLLGTQGFVSRRKEGLFAYYALADRSVFRLCEIMCGRLETDAKARRKVFAPSGR